MKSHRGFSLLEVLISVLILSIGLLGIAGLQANAIRYNQSGTLRSLAIFQAESMLDRMRANMVGVNAGSYNSVSGIPGATSCSGSCSSAQIATTDVSAWNTENLALLPQGQGNVVRNGNNFVITVQWDNDRSGNLTSVQLSSEL